VVLGESPGTQEVQRGEPFVGPSGGELNKLLKSVGLDREEIYITNTYKELPKGKKDDFFFNSEGPTQPLMDGVLELIEEFKDLSPNVVVPLGNVALWAMTQQWGISNWRGSIMESTLVQEQKVIPTYHPAYFMHSNMWHQFTLVEWDWQKIKRESYSPHINLPQYEIITDPTPEQVDDAVWRFLSADYLTVDSEWYSPENLAYVGFADSNDYAVIIPDNMAWRRRAIKTLLESQVPKVMQNAAFDVVALERVGFPVRNIWDDTMIAFHACWGDLRSKSLGTIASVLTDFPYYKEEVTFVGKDDEKGQEYCGRDCLVTHIAMDKMRNEEFRISGGKQGYEISMSIMPAMTESSTIGILGDREKMLELKKFHLDSARDLEFSLAMRIGYTINVRSPKQVIDLVYNKLKIKRQKKSSAQDILMDIAASEDDGDVKDILTDIIKIRRHLNIVSRYINEDIFDTDGRIRTNWNLAGTINGRLSATKPWWNGVPLQTIPEDARSIYIADPGHIFIGWDLAQAEARVVALLTGDYNLLEEMEQGLDIHLTLASRLPFNRSYEELVEIKKVLGGEFPERTLAKTCRHAMNYYLSWKGLKTAVNKKYLDTNVGINAALAKTLREAYVELHPGLESWWEQVFSTMTRERSMSNALGRRRNFLGKIRKYSHEHRDGIAFYPQSTIADSTTLAIRDIKKRLPNAVVMTHMHDGGFIQVPEDMRDEAVEVVRECTTRELYVNKELLVVPTSVKEGYNWKDMETIRTS